MTAPARIGIKLLGISAAAVAFIYVAVFFLLESTRFRAWAQAEISAGTGLEIRLGDLTLQPPFGIAAGAVEVSKPGIFSLSAQRLSVMFTPFDLWFKTVHRVNAERPVLEIAITEIMQPSERPSTTLGLRHLNVKDGSLVLKKEDGAAVFELPNINVAAENLNLGQQAGISLRADIPLVKGEAELQLSGQMRALDVGLVIRSKRRQILPRREESKDSELDLVRLKAKIETSEDRQTDVTVEGQFQNLTAGERHYSGSLNARGAIDSAWKAATFNGGAVLLDFKNLFGVAGAKLPEGSASANFAGFYSLPDKVLTFKSMDINSPLGKGAGEGVAAFTPRPRITGAKILWTDIPLERLRPVLPAPLSQWNIQGSGQIRAEIAGPIDTLTAKGVARGDASKLHGDNFSLASLNFTMPFEWSNSITRIKEAKLVGTKLDYGGKGRWQGAADRVQISASTDLSGADSVKIGGTIESTGGKFSSSDNSRVGENLSIHGPLEFSWPRAKNSLGIRTTLGVQTGEILWGKFFSDFKVSKPAIELDADYSSGEDRLDCRRCSVNLLNVGEIAASGSIDRVTQIPELRLQARSTKFLPGGFFEYFLRGNLNRQFPVVDKLTVDGQLAFQTQLRGTLENLALDGELALKAGELRSQADNWGVGAVALALPFRIQLGERKAMANEVPRTGTLTIKNLRFGEQAAGPLSAAISLWGNELRFHGPLRATLFGGEIVIGNLVWPNVIGFPKQLSFALDAKRLQLEEITRALGWPRFSGTLTGSIPEVQSGAGTLKTIGEIQAALFGGRVRMSKLEIENPFSSLAAIKLDATLANIDLEQLSKTFAFGQISGILEGTVGDLIITDGQPAQFGADLHTVDRGGEQRISVEALNKITVLSSGQSAGALYGGLAGLFDSFRYSKLGFKAILRNDRLTLRGVETRGNEEYLVVGSFLPPTVNIVSHTQTIAFSELLRRLERIKANKPEVK